MNQSQMNEDIDKSMRLISALQDEHWTAICAENPVTYELTEYLVFPYESQVSLYHYCFSRSEAKQIKKDRKNDLRNSKNIKQSMTIRKVRTSDSAFRHHMIEDALSGFLQTTLR